MREGAQAPHSFNPGIQQTLICIIVSGASYHIDFQCVRNGKKQGVHRNVDVIVASKHVSDRMHTNKLPTWWRHQMETFSALLAFCAGNSPVPGQFPHKGQWRGALMFSLICGWTNGWLNNRETVDLRRYRAHYVVTVMYTQILRQGTLQIGNDRNINNCRRIMTTLISILYLMKPMYRWLKHANVVVCDQSRSIRMVH